MFNKQEVEELNRISDKIGEHLGRDISGEKVTDTLFEFIDLYEKTKAELEHIR